VVIFYQTQPENFSLIDLINCMDKKCSACMRKVSKNKYCQYHARVFDNLKEHYNTWIEAYGSISWNDYLNQLLQMNETGIWVKDVIIVELEDRKNMEDRKRINQR
jgi:hypothetical protein